MQHRIPLETLGADGPGMARAVATCVHCGFCLPTCPTYRVLGEEMDSPRGRILLMKQVLEGDLAPTEATPFVDRCLGCLGCVTACPSGVRYGELVGPFRERTREHQSWASRLRDRALLALLESPTRFRAAIRLGVAARPIARRLPGLSHLVGLLPPAVPPAAALPVVAEARGPRRARVALLTGCAQQALAPDINEATLRVLTANGIEVVVPPAQGCCGSLAMHAGYGDRARALARRVLDTFPADVDAIVTNAAGCGSGMKEYAALFRGRPDEARAAAVASRVRDVSEYLADLGPVTPFALGEPLRVAYHDACHLAHAQGVKAAPRRLLALVEHLDVREIADGDVCCGSAGLYNLQHPEVAAELGAQKAKAIAATGADAVVTGNIGCLVQVSAHLASRGRAIRVWHTVQVLDRACAG